MRVGKKIFAVVSAGLVSSFTAAYYYRPLPKFEKNSKYHPSETFVTTSPLIENADQPDPFLLKLARIWVIGSTATVTKAIVSFLNNLKVKKDHRYEYLLEVIERRPKGQSLITVSNHCSTMDDPGLFSSVFPYRYFFSPHLTRWGVCSQEYCYQTPLLSAFFGAGQTLPIKRGEGIDQQMWKDFSRRVAVGDWVHVFPEGKIDQSGHLGGRSNADFPLIGRLKWGTAKLIAHAPQPPIVIPFFHTGMQEIFPQDPVTNDVISMYPQRNKLVTVRFGNPIDFSDLIESYVREHGPLRKLITPSKEADTCNWESTEAEKKLYSLMTLRIEHALLELENEAIQDIEKDVFEIKSKK